jgi:heptosyltransferase-2
MPANLITVPDSILVRGVNWLGDAVMTTPALQRLREKFPHSRLTLLTHEKLKDLWRDHPSLDRVVTFCSKESPWTVGRRLREEEYDVAVLFPNSPRSALELWHARIPIRLGYARWWRNWFLTRKVTPPSTQFEMRKRSAREIDRLLTSPVATSSEKPTSLAHHIHAYLHLVATLGANPEPTAPLLHVTPAEIETAARRFDLQLDENQHSTQPLFGLNPGAEYGPAKRWPSTRFVAAAVEIAQRAKCRWVIFGTNRDIGLATEITKEIERLQLPSSLLPAPLNLAGKTTLRELCALLKLCSVVLTNDTGPMHVAAALGTPVVVPFGSTSAALTGPGLPGDPRHRLLACGAPCAPCFLRTCPIDFRCMTGIPIESVVEAVINAALPTPSKE